MTIWNMLFSIGITFAVTIVVHAQTNETECSKAWPSDVCCKKPGCMWVYCMYTPYNNKPIPHVACHAKSWEFEICKTTPDVVCPTGAVSGIGAFCKKGGGECEDIPGAYCNTTSVNTPYDYDIAKTTCQCAAIYALGNKHDTICNATNCNDTSTCVSLDPNSECVNSKCACKEGFQINSTSPYCIQRPATTLAPAPTTIADDCGSHGDNKTACCAATEVCKYVTCSSKDTKLNVGVCYKLDSYLDTKCDNVTVTKPADQCIPVTTPTPDPCAAFTDQGACCGASIGCRYINCTDKANGQAHTGCHGKDTDLTSVCSKVETNMCTADPETSPAPSSIPKPSTPAPGTLPPTTDTQDISNTTKRPETSANSGEEHGQHFDAASFVGGIILCAGIVAIAFFSWKFYNASTEKPYQSL